MQGESEVNIIRRPYLTQEDLDYYITAGTYKYNGNAIVL